jgi:NADP-dependent 3-hydroxy acid dehydrogenase YdfG
MRAFMPSRGRDLAMTSTQPATVLVTGASSGFGEAITRRFAAAGARVGAG